MSQSTFPMATPYVRTGPLWSLAGLAACLLVSSLPLLHKYGGVTGVAVYGIVGLSGLAIGYQYGPGLMRYVRSLSAKQFAAATAMTFLVLVVAFAVLYPISNTDRLSGHAGGGNDRDDAINIGAGELLHLRYPYYARTHMGNVFSPLPGALILAVPFVLIGNGAYQNIFWIFAFFLAAKYCLGAWRPALLMLWTILAFSPGAWRGLVTGSDLGTNCIYVLVSILLIVNVVPAASAPRWQKLAAAVFMGIAFSSRTSFLLLLPLVLSVLVQRAGWKVALNYAAVAAAAFVAVTVPFWLYDPGAFTPLQTNNPFAHFRSMLPLSTILVPGACGLVALGLSLKRNGGDQFVLLRDCAVVLALPVVCITLLEIIANGAINYYWLSYAEGLLFFGVLAWWIHFTGASEPQTRINGGQS